MEKMIKVNEKDIEDVIENLEGELKGELSRLRSLGMYSTIKCKAETIDSLKKIIGA